MFLSILRPEAEPARVVMKLKTFFKQKEAAFVEEYIMDSSLVGMERAGRESQSFIGLCRFF